MRLGRLRECLYPLIENVKNFQKLFLVPFMGGTTYIPLVNCQLGLLFIYLFVFGKNIPRFMDHFQAFTFQPTTVRMAEIHLLQLRQSTPFTPKTNMAGWIFNTNYIQIFNHWKLRCVSLSSASFRRCFRRCFHTNGSIFRSKHRGHYITNPNNAHF